jgi:hypothetical protein
MTTKPIRNHKLYRKIYEQHYGPIPKDSDNRTYEIHHIDGNSENNNPSNLIAVSIQEHYDIHYSQCDWGACSIMSTRMSISSDEKSLILSNAAKQRVIDGTNPFTSENIGKWSRKRVENGTHNFLGGAIQHKRIANGTHHFVGENHYKFDSRLYKFHHEQTEEEVIMLRSDFTKKYSVNRGNLANVIAGRAKTVQGWSVTALEIFA